MKNFFLATLVTLGYLAFSISYIPSARVAVVAPMIWIFVILGLAPFVFFGVLLFLRMIDSRQTVYSKGTDDSLYVYTKSHSKDTTLYKVSNINKNSFDELVEVLSDFYTPKGFVPSMSNDTERKMMLTGSNNSTICMFEGDGVIFIEFKNITDALLIFNIWKIG
ncbi:MAG: hypothetical protein PHE67_04970 [Campylobacterales bacterium]|nr:hypothetical protein [Campylobacterales bacterium]